MKSGFTALALACLALVQSAAAAERHVLFLADSHGLGPFGDSFERNLASSGLAEIETYALGGSAPSWFFHGTLSKCGYAGHASREQLPPAKRACAPMHTPYVEQVLRKGELVVVELGTNQIDDPLGWAYGKKMIQQLLAAIHKAGADCLWVGPPRMRHFPDSRLDGFYGVIADALATDTSGPVCPLIDSRPLTAYPATGGDGYHYSFPAGIPVAKAWGASVAQSVEKILAADAK